MEPGSSMTANHHFTHEGSDNPKIFNSKFKKAEIFFQKWDLIRKPALVWKILGWQISKFSPKTGLKLGGLVWKRTVSSLNADPWMTPLNKSSKKINAGRISNQAFIL